ncbi:YbhN family protein [Corynebacterium sp. sy039]|uniref:lysylphosphatidylglycerol synthase transmembrane domain-containing protein n=1 Tax=Corynebacterium sp. sy039 TaxID=2599641 RepID=UPI001FEE1D3D|nr:YbhN family protein [Corynebacterium sp. sy039]
MKKNNKTPGAIGRFMHNKWVRFLSPLVILCFVAFLLRDKMPFLAQGYDNVVHANPLLLIVAFLSIFISIVAMAEVMRLLLKAGGSHIPLRHTLHLTLVSNSWSSTFPGGAAISTVYQFHTMRKWQVSVLISSWFIIVSGALSTMWLIALGLIAIFFLNASFSLTPLVCSALFMSALALVVYAATNHPQHTKKIAVKVLRFWNRLRRRPVLDGVEKLEEHVDQLGNVRLSFWKFSWISLLSLTNWVLDILALWLCVGAVTDVLPGVIHIENNTTILGVTLAFVTSKIAGTAQVTPAGLGPVEASMTSALVATGMTVADAFGAVFAYRILSFVIITAIGWLLYAYSAIRGSGVQVGALASEKN